MRNICSTGASASVRKAGSRSQGRSHDGDEASWTRPAGKLVGQKSAVLSFRRQELPAGLQFNLCSFVN